MIQLIGEVSSGVALEEVQRCINAVMHSDQVRCVQKYKLLSVCKNIVSRRNKAVLSFSFQILSIKDLQYGKSKIILLTYRHSGL